MQQGKTLKAIILVLVVFLLIFGSFLGGLIAGNALPIKLLPGSQKTQTTQTAPLPQEAPAQSAEAGTDYTSSSTPEEQKQTFAPFWETWKLLHENFVDQPLDDVALMRGAIRHVGSHRR